MGDSAEKATPYFDEGCLYDTTSKHIKFNLRELIGIVSWIAVCSRPDIAQSVNSLARCANDDPTKAQVNAGKTILKFLKGTISRGLTYSPQQEKQFHEEYKKMCETEHNEPKKKSEKEVEKPLHVFSDASFGSEYKRLRSISGIIIFLHSMPVHWKSTVQTVHCNSSQSAEWVAASDAIQMAESVSGLQFFLENRPEDTDPEGPIWCDNKGAVQIARRGWDNFDEVPRKSRHVALRFAQVMDQHNRLFWTYTTAQKADCLTKSSNEFAIKNCLQNILGFEHKTANYKQKEQKEKDEKESKEEKEIVEKQRKLPKIVKNKKKDETDIDIGTD